MWLKGWRWVRRPSKSSVLCVTLSVSLLVLLLLASCLTAASGRRSHSLISSKTAGWTSGGVVSWDPLLPQSAPQTPQGVLVSSAVDSPLPEGVQDRPLLHRSRLRNLLQNLEDQMTRPLGQRRGVVIRGQSAVILRDLPVYRNAFEKLGFVMLDPGSEVSVAPGKNHHLSKLL